MPGRHLAGLAAGLVGAAALSLAGPLAGQRCAAPDDAVRVLGEVETPVVLTGSELDGGYWDRLPFLADRRDGAPLDDHARPFQVIVPDAPKHGRWVRQVACLRLAYPE